MIVFLLIFLISVGFVGAIGAWSAYINLADRQRVVLAGMYFGLFVVLCVFDVQMVRLLLSL